MEENRHTSLEETERYIYETERKVPVVAEVDVLDLGGGQREFLQRLLQLEKV